MGCHTWCYRKVPRSIEEGRAIWIKRQEKWIEDWKEITNDPNHEIRGEAVYPEWNQQYCEWALKVYERQLQMVKKGLLTCAVMNNQPEHSMWIPDKGFYVDCSGEGGFHDMFRIGGYPDDKLWSYEETLQFITDYEIKHDVEIKYDNERLQEFWDLYPDGMIEFG